MDSTRTFFDMAAALRRQSGFVAIILASGLAIAGAVFTASHTHYAATSTMLMVTESPAYDQQHVSLLTAKPLQSLDMASLVTNDTVLLQLRKQLGEDISLEKLGKRLRAKSNGESTVMPIQYTDTSELGAIRGANFVASDVSAFYQNLATKRIDQLIADLTGQTQLQAQNLARLDAQLQATAKQYPYIDTKADDQHSIYARLIALRSQRDDVAATVAADDSGARVTSSFIDNARPVALRDVIESDPVYGNARNAYAKDVAQLQHIKSFGGQDYPGLPELNDMVTRDHVALDSAKSVAASNGPASNAAYATALDNVARAQAVLESDRSKESALDNEISQIGDQLNQGGISLQVAQLRRHREQVENLYSTLESRRMQAIGDRAQTSAESSLIVMDPAQDAKIVIWSTGAFAAIAILMLTVWLALSLAMERDRVDRRFRTSADIESAYSSYVIGSLI